MSEGEKMQQEEAIRLASEVVKSRADQIAGLDSVRFLSPTRLTEEWVAEGVSISETPLGFRTKADYWAVSWKLRVPRGQVWCPATICVVVDDQTGEATLVPGL